MSLGFWAGANAFLEEKEAQKIKREEFLLEQFEKSKSLVIPELIARLDTKREKQAERKSRVAQGQIYGLSRRASLALEKTGQLEFELAKLAKKDISAEYISELTVAIESRLDTESPDYDEVLANAVSAGLEPDMISDEDRLEGLLLAINATDEEELNEALINLLPTSDSDTLKPSRIDYNIYKGGKVKDTTRVRIRNDIATRIAPMLGTELVSATNAEGITVFQLKDATKNEILLQVTDSVLDKYIDPRILVDDSVVVSEATNVIQDYSNLIKDTPNLNTNPAHFEHFEDIFKLVLPADGLTSSTEEWKRKLIVPDAPIDPLQHTHNDGKNHTHAGGNVTHEHSSDEADEDFDPETSEELQLP